MRDEQRQKRTGATYVAVVGWTAAFISMVWVVPAAAEMHVEMGSPIESPLPLVAGVLLGTPWAVWIVLGLVVGRALHWKSKLVCAKTGNVIDAIAVLALAPFVFLVLVALFLPLIGIVHSY